MSNAAESGTNGIFGAAANQMTPTMNSNKPRCNTLRIASNECQITRKNFKMYRMMISVPYSINTANLSVHATLGITLHRK
jgi:hypothetical protein